jgi:hypothetical protein
MSDEALKRLTYTQWEAWLAVGFNEAGKRKNLVIVQPAAVVKRGPNFESDDASRASQAEFSSAKAWKAATSLHSPESSEK